MGRAGPLSRARRWLARPAGRILAGFSLASLALWVLLTIGGEMAEGETEAFDRWALLALRDPVNLGDPIGPRWLEEAMRDITALGGFTVLTLITMIAVVSLWRGARRVEASVLAVVVIAAQLASDGLKLIYERPRPMLAPHLSYVYSNSFPSGHSAVSAALYILLAFIIAANLRRQASRTLVFGIAVLLVILIGVSRTYLGVHWPTDVLAGWALGSSGAILGAVALGHIQQSRDGGRQPRA